MIETISLDYLREPQVIELWNIMHPCGIISNLVCRLDKHHDYFIQIIIAVRTVIVKSVP